MKKLTKRQKDWIKRQDEEIARRRSERRDCKFYLLCLDVHAYNDQWRLDCGRCKLDRSRKPLDVAWDIVCRLKAKFADKFAKILVRRGFVKPKDWCPWAVELENPCAWGMV